MGNQRCGAQGAVAGSVTRLLKGLTSVVDNSCRSRDFNTQPRVTSPMLYPLGHDCPQSLLRRYLIAISLWRPHFFWRFLLKWELGICRPSPWPPVILTLRSAWPKPFCRGMSPKFLLSHHSQSYCRPSVVLPAGSQNSKSLIVLHTSTELPSGEGHAIGVGVEIDSLMRRDSLFNDSKYFRIDSELVYFSCICHVCAHAAGFIAHNLCSENAVRMQNAEFGMQYS